MNCDNEPSPCKELGTYPRKSPRLFVYTCNIVGNSGSMVEYHGDLVTKDLKVFCQEHLPRYSKRADLKGVDFSPDYGNGLPSVLLLSTKKDTPTIWRALSGLYHKRVNFYDAQVRQNTYILYYVNKFMLSWISCRMFHFSSVHSTVEFSNGRKLMQSYFFKHVCFSYLRSAVGSHAGS